MQGGLEQLAEAGIMRKPDGEALWGHYACLRSIESILRRWENKSISTLPADKVEQEKLARRAGAKSLDAFAETYRAARAGIHAVYSRYLL
jgi:glutamine synthetase adenylyltransferase